MIDRSPEESGRAAAVAAGELTATPQCGWRYPRMYAWFAFLAALDILLTYMILSPLFDERGREVNVLAEHVIQNYGLPGVVAYKYFLVGLVILICEFVGRRHPVKGRRLAEWSVALTAIPVVVSFTLMLVDVYAVTHPAIELE